MRRPRGNPHTDHDLLVELSTNFQTHILGENGVVARLGRIEDSLIGTVNGKPGWIPQFQEHLSQHKKILRRNEKIAAALGALVGSIAGSLSTIYGWLRELGFL